MASTFASPSHADLLLRHESATEVVDTSGGTGTYTYYGNSTYQFESTNPLGLDYTQLKAKVSLTFNYNPDGSSGNDLWQSTHVVGKAESTLHDVLTVQGVASEPGGWLQFFWTVDGQQALSFQLPSNQVNVSAFNASATLDATADGDSLPFDGSSPEVSLLTDVGNPQVFTGRAEPYSATPPLFLSDFSTLVPWTGNTSVAVDFRLTSTIELEMQSTGETPAFTATLQSDFSNTAKLVGVAVLNESQSLIPGATVFSATNGTYTAVPEPSVGLYLTGLLALFAAKSGTLRILPATNAGRQTS